MRNALPLTPFLCCKQGYYCTTSAQIACPTGQYSAAAALACTLCSAGRYNPYTAYTTCFSCPSGRYQTVAGQAACTNCAAGKYNSATGRTTACSSSCAAGKYSAAAASGCTSCAAGTFQSLTSSTSCKGIPTQHPDTAIVPLLLGALKGDIFVSHISC